jgi:hypothetical protein
MVYSYERLKVVDSEESETVFFKYLVENKASVI